MKYIKSALIVIACVAGNLLLMQLPYFSIMLPLVLNAVGICFVCYFTGLAGCLICGGVCALFVAPFGPHSIFFCIVGLVSAALIYLCFKKKIVDRLLPTLVSGYWIGFLCAFLNFFINSKFNDGYTYNAWGDALVDMLKHYGWSKFLASLLSGLFIELIDKQLTMLIFFVFIKIIHRNRDEEKSISEISAKSKEKHITKSNEKKAAKVISASLIVCMLMPFVGLHNTSAYDIAGLYNDNTGFATQIYNKRDGLLSNSATSIAQTDDGYIWIGSYEGLVKFDGTNYVHAYPSEIPNVTVLFKDSRGRLLIGTLDSGFAIMDNDGLKFLTEANGLPSNAIRCITEKEGVIYVGTSDKMCKINIDDKVSVIDEDISYASSIAAVNGLIVGCDLSGSLFALNREDKPIRIAQALQDEFFTCITPTSGGVMCGTSRNNIYTLSISENVIGIRTVKQSEFKGIRDICESMEGRIWICSENSVGYYDINGKYRRRHFNDASFTYESLFVDYQNNMWIVSSKYGLMKLSESNFLYLSERAGIPSKPANAAVKYRGKYYYGTDEGIKIQDRTDNSEVKNNLTETIGNASVRALFVDKRRRLWICTYNSDGIYVYDGNSIKNISRENDGLTSNNISNITGMSDGTIVAGTAEGLNFLKDDKVVKTITKKDGLNVPRILCLSEGTDGLLYAGTDGDGIVVIDGDRIAKKFTTKEGLSSDVIWRMMPYDDGMLVCTSGHLCYIKDDAVKALTNFPYDDSCDIVQYDTDRAYILGEEGVCDIELSGLVKGSVPNMHVYSEESGLMTNISTNAWNFIDDDGSLIFCTNMGVLAFNKIEKYAGYNYKYGVTSVACDGKPVEEENGIFNIPKDTKYVSINASVRDFTLEDIRVKFYVEGSAGSYGNDVTQTLSYKRISPISIYNPTPGKHNIHLQIFDSNENLIEDKTYILFREMRMWEHLWFRIYVIIVFVESVMMFTASIILLYVFTRRTGELENIKDDLEKAVNDKTHDLMQQQMRTVMALSDAIDAKDRYTSGHSARVAFYSKQIAAKMGKSKEEQNIIYRAGLLHDIGKIRVPGAIISKPGKLTEDEYTLMKLHPVTGYHILKSIGGDSMFAQGAHFHHERYDGRGYPNGLSGENIPEIARIIGVADAYDAMSSRRSYHDTFSQEFIHSEIEGGKGTQFDPVIADVMLKMMEEDNLYSMKEKDEKRVVLVIDDKQKRIDEIREIMRDESKYNILGALSGEIGLSILEETNVDLVLLDMTMPGMDGNETLKHIREKYSMPVIFMVEVSKLYEMQIASELGSDDFLTKPYVPIVLKEIVHNYTKTFEAEI